jgi:DNA-binding IclR family transcriptional regulator
MIDQELEVGVGSIAAPTHDASGTVVAAINADLSIGR